MEQYVKTTTAKKCFKLIFLMSVFIIRTVYSGLLPDMLVAFPSLTILVHTCGTLCTGSRSGIVSYKGSPPLFGAVSLVLLLYTCLRSLSWPRQVVMPWLEITLTGLHERLRDTTLLHNHETAQGLLDGRSHYLEW